MRILVISLAGIGDTLFATPLIRELRNNFPQATIDALVMWKGSRDVLEGNPNLNSIFQKNLIQSGRLGSFKFLGRLRRSRYDVSFNTHPQSRIHYRLVARFVNARLRISHEYGNSTIIDPLLVNRWLTQDYSKHSIINNLSLLPLVGAEMKEPGLGYEMFLSASDKQWAADFVETHQLEGRKLLGVHVGSGGTKNLALRRWPLSSYAELFDRLAKEQPKMSVLLFGGPGEENDHELLLRRSSGKLLVARSQNMRQSAALLAKCVAFLSVDTALMHVAAAMKVPIQAVIETPTWNTPIAPYRDDFLLIENPAIKGSNLKLYRYDGSGIRGTEEEIRNWMASVSVDHVFQVVSKALRNAPLSSNSAPSAA